MSLIQCGEDAAKHFAFDNGYRNLNHVSALLGIGANSARGTCSIEVATASAAIALRILQKQEEGYIHTARKKWAAADALRDRTARTLLKYATSSEISRPRRKRDLMPS